MQHRLRFVNLAACATIATVLAIGSIANAQSSMASPSPKARFSSAGSYTGAPDLPLTLSLVLAGGGPTDFDSVKLLGVLAGAQTKAEVVKLTKQFGAENVKSFLEVFNFVVNDSLVIVKNKAIKLPSTPDPSPSDGKALATALYKAGVTNGSYNVEYMLDKLVSHPIHIQVMDDIDAKYGAKADGNYHAVLTQAMLDLKAAYGL
jgi:hypothetical protein